MANEPPWQTLDVWTRLGYGLDSVPWMDEELEAERDRYMPATALTAHDPEAVLTQRAARRATILRAVSSLLWCAAAIGLIALTMRAGVSMFGYGALLGGLLFGLPRALRGTGIPSLVWSLIYYAFGAMSVVLTMSMVADSGPRFATILGVIVICVLYGLTLATWQKARELRAAVQSHAPVDHERGLVSAEQTEAQKVWGNALCAGDPGTDAQILTNQLLDTLLQIRTVRVVNNVRLPGGGGEDVDHTVLCGNLVFAIDSELWPGGHYAWHQDQIVHTAPEGTEVPDAPATLPDPLAVSAGGMRRLFLNEQVMSIIVIHPMDRQPVTVDNSERGRHPWLMTERDLIETLGRMCLDQETNTVDRYLLTALVQMHVEERPSTVGRPGQIVELSPGDD
jgi:hypothetical protein